jgi:hypothetical protein
MIGISQELFTELRAEIMTKVVEEEELMAADANPPLSLS